MPASTGRLQKEWLPRWSKRVTTEMGGRDPLGLSRVANNVLTDGLLTGIITTTSRARYYSMYSWVLSHIEREDAPKNYQQFQDAFRRREAVIALATLSANPKASFAGNSATKAWYEKGAPRGEFNCDFRTLPANQLGGYGQYYSGCLYDLGLRYTKEDGIDRVVEGAGTALAEAVDEAIAKTPYITDHLYRQKTIPASALKKSAERLTLDGIRDPFAARERQLLTDLFFGLSKNNPGERVLLRRMTLSRVLHLVREYQRAKIPVTWKSLDQQLVYGPSYYGVLVSEDRAVTNYSIPEALSPADALWRQFSLHQYLAIALEDLLWSVLETLAPHGRGLTEEEIVDSLMRREFLTFLKRLTGETCETPASLLSAVGVDGQSTNDTSVSLQRRLGFKHRFSEESIIDRAGEDPPTASASAVCLLAVLYGKWRGITSDGAYSDLHGRCGSELWAGTVLPALDSWRRDDLDWKTAFLRLLAPLILDQHDRVMYEKRRLDSCWLTRVEGGRFIKEQDYESFRRSSRHGNVVSILVDLRLLADDAARGIQLTDEGERLISRLLGSAS